MKELKRVATTADRLREVMRDAGKKQVDLVRDTGLNRGTISRYLSGEVEPRQTAMAKLAAALGVSEFYLWGYDVPRERSQAQKKNDAIVGVVGKLRYDDEFLDVVTQLAELPADQYASIKNILAALRQK